MTMADVAELSEADDALLFNELRDAEARADRRKRGQEPDEEPAPEEPGDAKESSEEATPAKLSDEKEEGGSSDDPDPVAS